MKRASCLVAVSMVVLLSICIPLSSDVSEGSSETLLISEVNPYTAMEGFSLHNYGSSKVNLKDYNITDGVGTLRFTANKDLPSNSRVTVVGKTDPDDWFSSRDNTYIIGSADVSKSGNFGLTDAGDVLYLFKGETLIDSVCYGNKTADKGWNGPPVERASSKYLLRNGLVDTDTSSDWIFTKPGITNLPFDPSIKFDAVVTPFTFPESSGIPVYKAFENAKSEILISIYQLTNPDLVALLCALEKKVGNTHVDVYILLEGDVLNYDMSTELSLMQSIFEAGGEVKLINNKTAGNYERYAYVHNKYAIIDSEKVIITSENWTVGNMDLMKKNKGNRGWGAVIDSVEYAKYMKNVFINDTDTSLGDVWKLEDFYPTLKPYEKELTYPSIPEYRTESFRAVVTPILSPDNSYSAQKYYMDNAEFRIFSEQLDLGSSFEGMNASSPVSWMVDATRRNNNFDARLILDASMSTSKTSHTEEVNLINRTTNVKAMTINGGNGFTTTHNKGIIIDDTVWLGSVNWTSNSFMNNRETAVLIDSTEVTEYFVGYFLEDWGDDTQSMRISVDKGRITSGDSVVFTVSGKTDEKYEWDIYGDGKIIRQSNTNKIVCSDLVPGTYIMKVTDSESNSVIFEYTVFSAEGRVEPENDGIIDVVEKNPGIIAVIAGIFSVIVIALIKGKR
jgi:hypothetical protein